MFLLFKKILFLQPLTKYISNLIDSLRCGLDPDTLIFYPLFLVNQEIPQCYRLSRFAASVRWPRQRFWNTGLRNYGETVPSALSDATLIGVKY